MPCGPTVTHPTGAARSMRTYLSRLRTVLPGISITTQPSGYVLDVNGARVDLDEFDDLLGEAESSVPDRALGLYDEALSLWRGDPFGEFADEWWALPESTRLRERHALGRSRARRGADGDGPPQPGDPRPRTVGRRASARRATRHAADAGPAGNRTPGRVDAGRQGVPRPTRRADRAGAVGAAGPARGCRRHRCGRPSSAGGPAVARLHPPRGDRRGRPRAGVRGDAAGHRTARGGEGDPSRSRRLDGLRRPLRGRGPADRPPRAPAHRPAVRRLARARRRLPRVPVARRRDAARLDHQRRTVVAATRRRGWSRRSAGRSSPPTPVV